MALGGTYTTGTVSTDGSDPKKLNFSGTLLSSVVTEGDVFMANGLLGRIASVDDDTHITLDQDWPGGALTDAAYLIDKTSYKRYDPAITQAKVRDLITLLHAQGSFLFVSSASPDPAMGEDGQYALKTNGGPWQLWYKTGGIWEAQGIPVGTTFRGEWDSATEYFANDQVGHNGSTWGAIAGSTNVVPGTDEAKWSLSAQKGADGQHGGAVSFTQVFSTSTSNADPGDGMLRLNNATQSLATVIRTDYLDKDGNSLTDLVGSFTTSTSTVKGQIRLAEVGDPTRWIVFDLTAKSDMTGYFNLTVAHVAHSTNPLRDAQEIGFYFTPKGDVGQQGIQGNQGYAPVLAVVSDGDRRVFQVTDWTGSTGTKPATGKYVGTSGLVDVIGDAIDVRGTQGIQGEQGLGIQPDASGPLADRDTYDDEAAGFVFVDTDATPFNLYIKLSATTADWSAASPIGGAGDMLASVYDPNTVAGDAFDLDNMSPAPGATGKLLFTATTAADALDTLGATTVGVGVLTATDAAAARTALGVDPVIPQAGRLTYVSSTAIKFAPCNGDQIKIGGVIYPIPAAGIAGVANTSVYVNGTSGQNLAASTTYYVYAFVNSGAVTADFRTDGNGHLPSDTAGNVGVEVRVSSGTTKDDSRTLIGMVRTNSSSQFADSASQRFVLSWFNRRSRAGSAAFTANRTTTSTTYVELNSEIRNNFLIWADEAIQVSVAGAGDNSTANRVLTTSVGFDGTTAEDAYNTEQAYANGGQSSVGLTLNKSGLSEGYHYATVLGSTTSPGTATWYGGSTAGERTTLSTMTTG